MLYASLDRPNTDRPRSKSRTPAKIQRWAAVSNQAKSIASPPRIPEAETGASLSGGNGVLATFSIPMRRSPSTTTRHPEVSSPSPRSSHSRPASRQQERRDDLNGFRLSEQKEEDSIEDLTEKFHRKSVNNIEDLSTPDSQRSQTEGGSKLPPTPLRKSTSGVDELDNNLANSITSNNSHSRRPSQTSSGLPKTPKRRVSVDLSPPLALSSPSQSHGNGHDREHEHDNEESTYENEHDTSSNTNNINNFLPPLSLPVASPVMEPAPLMTEESSPTPVGPRPKSRLHHEISECCEQLRATSKEFQRRQSACERVSALIFDLWADVEVHLVGSTATHLFLSDSDIDIVVRAPKDGEELTMADLMQLGQHLERYATHLQVVSTASVPLIKMVDSVTKFTLDITLNISTGLYSTALIMQYLDDFAPLKPLILVLKQLLKIHSLNELYRGGIPSYTLGLMIVSFLQFHTDNQKKAFNPAGDLQPGLESERHGEFEDFIRQTEREHARRAPSCSDEDSDLEAHDVEEWEGYEEDVSDEEAVVYRMNWQTDYDVGNLLLSFLELYGKSFDYTKHGITCKDGGGYFPKRTRKWWHPHDPTLLCLENPVDPTVDLGFKIYHIDRVRKLFASVLEHLTPDPVSGRPAYELRHLLQLPGGSSLGPGYSSPAALERRLPRSRTDSPLDSALATPSSAVLSSPESVDGKSRTFSLSDNTHNTHQKYNQTPSLPSSPVQTKMMPVRNTSSSITNGSNGGSYSSISKSQKSSRGRPARGGRGPLESRSRTESGNSLQNGRGGDRKHSVNSNSSTQSGGWRTDRYSSNRSQTNRSTSSNQRVDLDRDRRGSASSVQSSHSHSGNSNSSSSSSNSSSSNNSSSSSSNSHHGSSHSHHYSDPVPPTVVLHRPVDSPHANGKSSSSKSLSLSIQLPNQTKSPQLAQRTNTALPLSKPSVTVTARSNSRPQSNLSPKKQSQQSQQTKSKPRTDLKPESKKSTKSFYDLKK